MVCGGRGRGIEEGVWYTGIVCLGGVYPGGVRIGVSSGGGGYLLGVSAQGLSDHGECLPREVSRQTPRPPPTHGMATVAVGTHPTGMHTCYSTGCF